MGFNSGFKGLIYFFLEMYLWQLSFLPLSVGLSSLILSNSALHKTVVTIFAGSAIGCLKSCKTCSEIEGSGLRLAALNGLHDEAVGVCVWSGCCWSIGKDFEELEVATLDLLEMLASLNRKSLNPACCAEVCFITYLVDKPFVHNPYPELDNQYSCRSCGSVDRYHFSGTWQVHTG